MEFWLFVKGISKKILPYFLWQWLRRMKARSRIRRSAKTEYKDRSQVFNEIYAKKKWGHEYAQRTDFCSGLGSLPQATGEFEDFIVDFIKSREIKTFVDLGCGDFQVSKRILDKLDSNVVYIGCDIVAAVVERNRRKYGNKNTSFMVVDAVKDYIPNGDLLLIRETLQHLRNCDVQTVLNKTQAFRYVLVTETVDPDPAMFNPDIPTGASRALLSSGLFLEKEPFNMPVEEVHSYPHGFSNAVVRTVLIEKSLTEDAPLS